MNAKESKLPNLSAWLVGKLRDHRVRHDDAVCGAACAKDDEALADEIQHTFQSECNTARKMEQPNNDLEKRIREIVFSHWPTAMLPGRYETLAAELVAAFKEAEQPGDAPRGDHNAMAVAMRRCGWTDGDEHKIARRAFTDGWVLSERRKDGHVPHGGAS